MVLALVANGLFPIGGPGCWGLPGTGHLALPVTRCLNWQAANHRPLKNTSRATDTRLAGVTAVIPLGGASTIVASPGSPRRARGGERERFGRSALGAVGEAALVPVAHLVVFELVDGYLDVRVPNVRRQSTVTRGAKHEPPPRPTGRCRPKAHSEAEVAWDRGPSRAHSSR